MCGVGNIGNIIGGIASRFSERSGNVATSFALTLIPLMTMIGFAVDFSRTDGASANVQYSLDGAVLAAARELQKTSDDDEIKSIARKYFNGSMNTNATSVDCTAPSISIDRVEHMVFGEVDCSQPTTLSGIIGMTEINFSRKAVTDYGIGKLDVVFMFDTSGSMGEEGRMWDLRTAAKKAVGTILDSEVEDPQDVRIAISTYASSVNVGSDLFKAVTDEEPDQWDCTRWKRKRGEWTCQRWEQVSGTCVTGREGTHKYDDAAPGPGAWIPYDTTNCNSATLLPLTNKKRSLEDMIDDLPTTGSTAGHLGIVWSWYLLSPKWSGIWTGDSTPRDYDDPDLTKVAVLMTDGAFNVDYMTGGDSFAHAKKYCDAMKEAGVEIYTVSFKAPRNGRDILEYCATNKSNAYEAKDGDELEEAYAAIATSVSDLRIAH